MWARAREKWDASCGELCTVPSLELPIEALVKRVVFSGSTLLQNEIPHYYLMRKFSEGMGDLVCPPHLVSLLELLPGTAAPTESIGSGLSRDLPGLGAARAHPAQLTLWFSRSWKAHGQLSSPRCLGNPSWDVLWMSGSAVHFSGLQWSSENGHYDSVRSTHPTLWHHLWFRLQWR